ncbi:MAG: ATP-binding cassette domain-containing protein [Planctomycetota bacterium]|nr:ATP-binding cassette domain-containing protein [Planctomycetota bacterium]
MIAVRDLTVRAGAFRLEGISFEAATGQYAVLMGKTGSGKTTVLECVCGLRRMVSGRIELMGSDVTRLRPAERGIGYVPQDGALFLTMSVHEHLAFALTIRATPPDAIARRVRELAELLGITHLLGRRPQGLSAGETQRVALGRALAAQPRILCLDEPLNALDRETHSQMCTLLKDVSRRTGVTTLHITHDPEEARCLADRVLMLQDGKIVEQRP